MHCSFDVYRLTDVLGMEVTGDTIEVWASLAVRVLADGVGLILPQLQERK